MDQAQANKLASFIRQGRVILFTGAGFSVDAKAKSGSALPSVERLRRALWEVAFRGEEFDDSSLGDVYEAATRQASTETQRVMKDLLTVDPNSLDEGYNLWFSFPWHRIYTLNIDDLADAANRAFNLPRRLETLSALTQPAPAGDAGDALQIVHLNGTLADLPHVTFSPRQYAERMATSDLWYRNLSIELLTHPILYVGTSLDEPSLWMYIEDRGTRAAAHETRPGSFLVSPALTRARRVGLSAYNVSWVEATSKDFASTVLSGLVEEAAEGSRALETRKRQERGGPPVARVSDLQSDSQDDEREFLMGREPRWSDITVGYAITRDFDSQLLQEFEDEPARLIVLTGTAGSGKSTSAMRLALARSASGEEVSVLSMDTGGSLHELRQLVKTTNTDLLFIDDADRFGKSTPGFIHELLDDNPKMRVLACVRSTRGQTLDDLKELAVDSLERTVPELVDTDVDGLLDELDRANRLGALKGKTRKQQRDVMQRKFGRQLLVALLEVTQGVKFEQKIESECQDLKGDAPLLYAVAALSTYTGGPLSDQEMYVAAGDATAAKEQIDVLTARHLLTRTAGGRLMPRHKVIAERVVRYYQAKGIIAQVCTALAVGLASGSRLTDLRANRTGRILIRLLNHENLIKLIYRGTDSVESKADIRNIYDSVETLLRDDHHYWLQRGSFETEEGDLDLAKNFLDQARAMAGHDYNVRAQWSYMTLKRASAHAGDVGATEEAEMAFGELEELVEKRGAKDQYVFHIYGSQGLMWATKAPLAFDDRKRLLERLRKVVAEGQRLHPGNDHLNGLKAKLDNSYMRLALPAQSSG